MSRQKKQEVTLKDVAAAAGVSVMSVSNVVNERWDLVSERTRAVIEKEIKRLQYQPQMAGRSLRTGKTNAIGLIVLQGSEDGLRFARRAQATLAGFLEATAGQGYSVTHIMRKHATIEAAVGSLAQRLDGLALLLDGSVEVRKKDVAILSTLALPIVELEGLRLAELSDACSIYERAESQINAIATAISKGTPGRIHYVGGKERNERAERRFRHLKVSPLLRHFAFSEVQDYRAVLQATEPNASAIFVSSETDYCEMAISLSRNGRQDLIDRITCLDVDLPLSSADSHLGVPGIHTVAFRVGTIGGNALMARLSSSAFTYRQIAVDCGVVTPTVQKP